MVLSVVAAFACFPFSPACACFVVCVPVSPACACLVTPFSRPRRRKTLHCSPPSPCFVFVGRCWSCRVWGASLAHRTRHRQDTQLRPATRQPHRMVLHNDWCPHLQQVSPARPAGFSGAVVVTSGAVPPFFPRSFPSNFTATGLKFYFGGLGCLTIG